MSKLLNCFGRVETEVDASGYSLLETSTAGTYSVQMAPGIYRIVLIGSGGGGAKTVWGAGHSLFYAYAQGGVGATADIYVEVNNTVTATVVIGARGTSDNRTAGADTSATSGNAAYITGIPNLVLNCGAGTAGNIVSQVGHPGSMGWLNLSGSAIKQIDMNSNEHQITSSAVSNPRNNTNWPTYPAYGRGGGVSAGSVSVTYHGGTGYCYIRFYNKNYFHQ